jgi:hypothetical protein
MVQPGGLFSRSEALRLEGRNGAGNWWHAQARGIGACIILHFTICDTHKRGVIRFFLGTVVGPYGISGYLLDNV